MDPGFLLCRKASARVSHVLIFSLHFAWNNKGVPGACRFCYKTTPLPNVRKLTRTLV